MALRHVVTISLQNQFTRLHLTPTLVLKCKIHTTAYLGYDDNPPYESQRFTIPNLKGQFEYKKLPRALAEKEFNYPYRIDQFRQKYPGYYIDGKFHYVKEMEPELIVPDLTDFKLKPYVSYRAGDIEEPPLTAQKIFDKVYAPEILRRIEAGKSIKARLTARDIHLAKVKARQTGSDLMSVKNHYGIGSDDWPTHAPRVWIHRRRNPRLNKDLGRVNS